MGFDSQIGQNGIQIHSMHFSSSSCAYSHMVLASTICIQFQAFNFVLRLGVICVNIVGKIFSCGTPVQKIIYIVLHKKMGVFQGILQMDNY